MVIPGIRSGKFASEETRSTYRWLGTRDLETGTRADVQLGTNDLGEMPGLGTMIETQNKQASRLTKERKKSKPTSANDSEEIRKKTASTTQRKP